MRTVLAAIPRTGKRGKRGAVNPRRTSGCLYRQRMREAFTRMNAKRNESPAVVATTFRFGNRTRKSMTTPLRRIAVLGARYFMCTRPRYFGSTPSRPIANERRDAEKTGAGGAADDRDDRGADVQNRGGTPRIEEGPRSSAGRGRDRRQRNECDEDVEGYDNRKGEEHRPRDRALRVPYLLPRLRDDLVPLEGDERQGHRGKNTAS